MGKKKAPRLLESSDQSRTLSWDPGAKNFAYAFHINGKLVETGLMDTSGNAGFINCTIDLLQRLQPNHAVLERYMYRGAASTDSEIVNQRIGQLDILVSIYCGIDVCKITAAQWKLYFKKLLGKAKGDKFSSFMIYPDIEIEHKADASCIGRYYDEYWKQQK